MEATLLTDIHPRMDVVSEGIRTSDDVQSYDEIEPVFQAISDSPHGLQCGIFTNSLDLALSAFRKVRTGGMIVNGTSRWRSDQMPYSESRTAASGVRVPSSPSVT